MFYVKLVLVIDFEQHRHMRSNLIFTMMKNRRILILLLILSMSVIPLFAVSFRTGGGALMDYLSLPGYSGLFTMAKANVDLGMDIGDHIDVYGSYSFSTGPESDRGYAFTSIPAIYSHKIGVGMNYGFTEIVGLKMDMGLDIKKYDHNRSFFPMIYISGGPIFSLFKNPSLFTSYEIEVPVSIAFNGSGFSVSSGLIFSMHISSRYDGGVYI